MSTLALSPRAARRKARVSPIEALIASEAIEGPAHGREVCVSGLTRRAWNGDASAVAAMLTRDSLGVDGAAQMALTDSEIDALISGIEGE